MLPPSFSFLIIYVSDMSRSVAFYRDTLGLPLRFQTPDWSEFATAGVTLALHSAEPGTLPSEPQPAGAVGLGWQVEDLDAVYAELKSRGVQFVMEPSSRPGEPIRLAVFTDPDGCRLSLSQAI